MDVTNPHVLLYLTWYACMHYSSKLASSFEISLLVVDCADSFVLHNCRRAKTSHVPSLRSIQVMT